MSNKNVFKISASSNPVSIVMPAYNAQATIISAVRSVLSQTYNAWELIIVADDGFDYAAFLHSHAITDPRIIYSESGNIGGGSPPARNKGLDLACYQLSAILDADDAFAPTKLELMIPTALQYGLSSCALNVVTPQFELLRTVGDGEDMLLTTDTYKFTNISMDSMLVYDRKRVDPRFDPDLLCLTDLDFLLKIFQQVEQCYHHGAPLHNYVKMPLSVSNGPGVTDRMIAMKKHLLSRIEDNYYNSNSGAKPYGIAQFLKTSLRAEQNFELKLNKNRNTLFEDHLTTYLKV